MAEMDSTVLKCLEKFVQDKGLAKTVKPHDLQALSSQITSETRGTKSMTEGRQTDVRMGEAESEKKQPVQEARHPLSCKAAGKQGNGGKSSAEAKEEKKVLDKGYIEKQYPAKEWRDLVTKIEQIVQDKDEALRQTEEKLKKQEAVDRHTSAPGTPNLQTPDAKDKQDNVGSSTSAAKDEKKQPVQERQLRSYKASEKQGNGGSSKPAEIGKQSSAQGSPQSQSSKTTETQKTDGSGKSSAKGSRQKPNGDSQDLQAQKNKKAKREDQDDSSLSSILVKLREHFDFRDKALNHYEEECEDLTKRLDQEIRSNRDTHDAFKQATERANENERMLEKLQKDTVDCENQLEEKKKVLSEVEKELKNFKEEKDDLQKNNNSLLDVNKHLTKTCQKQDGKIEDLKQKIEDNNKHFSKEIEALKKERDDYRDRFSKMAGDRLTEKNADIADLSDPNRAMKLAEKFSGLYDDEWTDAYTSLCDKKIPQKDVLKILLQILKTCYNTCEEIAAEQLKCLTSAVVFPVKTVGQATKEMSGGLKGAPRLGTKNEKILINARRQMWEASVDVVRQLLLEQTKEWISKELDSKAFDDTKSYVEKCAEMCWLMVIHDPPVCMKTEAASDEKMDPNVYTALSASGQKVDFIVWPPLYNGKGGGLLSKGVVETIRTVTKDKKSKT